MKTIVTKSEFAKLKNRQPSAISNWIAEGKITKAALEGEGVRARIWVEQANDDLARSLDPSQQLAQEHPVLPDVAAPLAPQAGPADNVLPFGRSPAAGAATQRDDDLRRRLAADATRAEQEAIAATRKNAIEEGRWGDVGALKREFAKQLAKQVSDTETFLFNTLAHKIADENGLDWKPLAVLMRAQFHLFRASAGEDAVNELKQREAALQAAE